ncbi:hypothetical protein Xen7305DRAFT_00044510 [Xenococcus sp. PCC 7305]|uniref:hypothetical protein n=1 Tax=Xenococcus sp. PCC 7305 TaxID=102125 RepID=UPI0002ACE5D1|nr:hypothetical protein [Xenococcus sp. PCC 7305]ELS04715.1 hypothetical protein Xen7305DRAFT_00044510 [Xenococcus sp. PCC 7305]
MPLLKIEPPGIFITFLYYFACTNVIIFLIAFTQSSRIGVDESVLYELGLVVGLLTGILGAKFNRSVTITATYKKSKNFEKTIGKVINDLGFTPNSQLEGFTVYQIPSLKSLFVGKLFVQVEKRSATIICRASLAKQIRKNDKLQEYF